MTKRQQLVNKFLSEGKLKEFDSINLGSVGFHLKYGTNIIKHNEVGTLLTCCNIAVVVGEE